MLFRSKLPNQETEPIPPVHNTNQSPRTGYNSATTPCHKHNTSQPKSGDGSDGAPRLFRYPVYAFSRQLYGLNGRDKKYSQAKPDKHKKPRPIRTYNCNEKLRTQDMEKSRRSVCSGPVRLNLINRLPNIPPTVSLLKPNQFHRLISIGPSRLKVLTSSRHP